MVSSLAGTTPRSATTISSVPRQPCSARVGNRRCDEQRGAGGDRAEVSGRRACEEEAAERVASGSGCQATLCSNCAPPAADQVIADVRAPRVGRPLGNLPRAFDALQRERSWPSPVGSASSSTAWRYRSRLRKSIRP